LRGLAQLVSAHGLPARLCDDGM